ncbi:TPA: portal protein, partial [Escherichia coli]|nr:portal protein [Escherichia coli]HDC0950412.1 portal protein [Escherichia coli]
MKNETNTMATKNDNGATPRFSQRQLQALCSDIDSQPKWRDAANKACAYYDGDQLPPEVLQVLKDRGQPMTIHNLIAPTVDGVLGMEAKTRTDLVVMSDEPDDETEKLAEAINAEFADACRLGNMNKARSDAYAEQIKAGLSWVEVRRNSDPFGPEFKVSTVSRNEVFWDWLSREADLSDCRWLMRRRWMDTDEAKATFPGMAQVIDYAIDDWRGFVDTTVTEGQPSPLMSAWEEYQSWDRQQNEWLQRERRRVLLQVVYYRTFERLPVIELSNGRVVAFDKNNLMQAVAVASGRVQVKVGRVSRIREAWFVGPHFIVDRPCSAPQGMFPLVPFWGYRKDKTGEPYGLISRAIPAQDEVNFRRIKL